MPDVKAYAVSDATTLTALAESDDLMELLPAGEYNLTLDSTATVTVPALTAGSIDQSSPSLGDTLTVSGSNAPASGIAYQWQESATGAFAGEEVPISGATSASLDTSSGVTTDYYVRRGIEITGVQAMVYTSGVQVSAASTFDPFADLTSAQLLLALDATDTATLWTTLGRTTHPTDGQSVAAMDDAGANGNDVKSTDVNPFATWHDNSGDPYLDLVDVGANNMIVAAAPANLQGKTVSVWAVVDTQADAGWMLLSANSTHAIGVAQDGNASAPDSGGTVTSYGADGVTLTSPDRGALHTAWDTSGSWVLAHAEGCALANAAWNGSGVRPLSYPAASLRYSGRFKYFFVTDDSEMSAADRTNLIDWLKAQAGIS